MSYDYLGVLEEVQKEIRKSFALADDYYGNEVIAESRVHTALTDISSSLQDADVMLEQSLHALRDDGPCEDCGYKMDY